MEYGHVIRTERLKQDMKQIVLAKGICAPSYLSRIEQGLTVPSEEIIMLLLEKLGIDYNGLKKIESKDEIRFEKNLREIYKDILINRNKEFIKQKVKELEKEDGIFKDISLYYTYLLVLLRFRLMLGVNFHELEKDLIVGLHYFPNLKMKTKSCMIIILNFMNHCIKNRGYPKTLLFKQLSISLNYKIIDMPVNIHLYWLKNILIWVVTSCHLFILKRQKSTVLWERIF